LPSSSLIGYVIDAIPRYNKIEIVLNGFRKASIETTYPIYVITNEPEKIMQIPDIVKYYEEEWRTIDNRKIKVYRFESRSIEAYYYLKNKVEVVNEFPSIISQTLERLKALPMHKVKIENNKIELLENENSIEFPEINYAKIELEDWYGKSPRGKNYILYLNGKRKEEGDIGDLELEVDVAECSGISYDKVKASVKVLEEKKRSPVSIKGLIEWSKTAKVLLREIRYATIGKALTTNEAWIALKRKILIPRIKINVEKKRSLDELIFADKGGLILFPNTGFYENVYQLDFSSMYPSIIVKYNISAETIDICDDLKTPLHNICLKEKGIVPEALEKLIERKNKLKAIDEERAEAIKWMLVASFGYLGYRNSRFGKIEAYEMVTYFARETMRKAMDIAKKNGLIVLHGLIDSLFIKGENIESYIEEVEKETGLRMKIEANFDWVIFTKNRTGEPYPQRYFGKLKNGGMKIKAVIKDNMPNLIKEFLNDIFKELEKASCYEEVKEIIENFDLREYKLRAFYGKPVDYVLWIKGKPYLRNSKGFYRAELGYKGHDPYYYLAYLERVYSDLLSWIA